MPLPERMYYPLAKAAVKLNCGVDDLFHYASIGVLQLCVYINIDEKNNAHNATVVSNWKDELRENVELGFIDKLSLSTGLYKISESASHFSSTQDTKVTSISGWFAIDQIYLQEPSFEMTGCISIKRLLLPREKSQVTYSTDGYTPVALSFDEMIDYSQDDFFILSNEMKLIENGGKTLFMDTLLAKMNDYLIKEPEQSKKTTNAQAKLIKSLLYLIYKNTDLIDNPRNYIDDHKSEICTDFQAAGLTLPVGKTVERWLKDVDIDIALDK